MAELPPDSVHPPSREAWRAWLAEHHDRDDGVWFVFFKKATGKPTVSYDEAVDEAICFGWIDSRPRTLDAERSMRYFSPRKPGSGWSRVNKARIVRMTDAGRMTPAGQAKIDAAKADGSWGALDDVENLIVPGDLAGAFDDCPGAAAHWENFPRSVKRGILEWIGNAKRDATRKKRVSETARLAQKNERANQWTRKTS